jgi:hypothetical protein
LALSQRQVRRARNFCWLTPNSVYVGTFYRARCLFVRAEYHVAHDKAELAAAVAAYKKDGSSGSHH